jgi:DNA polymerase III subunit delta
MSRAALQILGKHIEQKRFDRAYYFYGDEEYRKDRALQALIASAVDPATRDFNFDQRRGTGLDSASLGTLLAMPPMLAERRLIVLRDIGGLKKDTRVVLEQYLRKPANDAILVLIAAAGEKADAALLQLATGVEFAPLDEPKTMPWMIDHARDAHSARLSEAAAGLLYAAVGNDLTALAAEIDKCVSYAGAEVDTDAVEAVVGVRHGETLGDLLEAIAHRRVADALRLVPRVLAQSKNNPVTIISALGTQLLAIGTAAAALRGGMREGAVSNQLFNLLKTGNAMTGGPWGEAVRRWISAAPLWPEAAIESGLRQLLAADRGFKDSRVGTDEQLVSTLVLGLCGGAWHAAAD